MSGIDGFARQVLLELFLGPFFFLSRWLIARLGFVGNLVHVYEQQRTASQCLVVFARLFSKGRCALYAGGR